MVKITKSFLLLNAISIVFNLNVGFALAFAKWDIAYKNLGLFSLTCWGIVFLFQLKLFQKYVAQYRLDNIKCDLNDKQGHLQRTQICQSTKCKVALFIFVIVFLAIFVNIFK